MNSNPWNWIYCIVEEDSCSGEIIYVDEEDKIRFNKGLTQTDLNDLFRQIKEG